MVLRHSSSKMATLTALAALVAITTPPPPPAYPAKCRALAQRYCQVSHGFEGAEQGERDAASKAS